MNLVDWGWEIYRVSNVQDPAAALGIACTLRKGDKCCKHRGIVLTFEPRCFCSSILWAWLGLRPSLSGWRPASAARRRPFYRTRPVTPAEPVQLRRAMRNLCDQAAEIDASVVAELPEDAASRIGYRLILPVGGWCQMLFVRV